MSITLITIVILALLLVLTGMSLGIWLTPRLEARQRTETAEQEGITVGQMFQQIITHISLGIAVVDHYRDVVFHNERADTLHLTHDRLLNEDAWQAAQRVFAGEEDVQFDLSSAQSGVSVRGYAHLLCEEDPRFAVVVVGDQSEQARIEAIRRDFVANVTHELKTPVGAMSLLAEALLESADDPVMVRRFASKVLEESQRLALMMSELIELSRLQGGEPLSRVAIVDIDVVVSETIVRHKIAADNAQITITTDASTGYQVLGDHTLLVTALANLVSNAINYSSRGSSVSISRRRRDGYIEISVTDRGIGIAQADQERVFERFFRSDKARSRATGGTGLGLSIVKHIAASHNGTITLWSQLGTGSTFTLSIPEYRGDCDDNTTTGVSLS